MPVVYEWDIDGFQILRVKMVLVGESFEIVLDEITIPEIKRSESTKTRTSVPCEGEQCMITAGVFVPFEVFEDGFSALG